MQIEKAIWDCMVDQQMEIGVPTIVLGNVKRELDANKIFYEETRHSIACIKEEIVGHVGKHRRKFINGIGIRYIEDDDFQGGTVIPTTILNIAIEKKLLK